MRQPYNPDALYLWSSSHKRSPLEAMIRHRRRMSVEENPEPERSNALMNIMNRTILCACLVTGSTLSLATQSSQSSADVISATAAQASGPDGRQITDPRTLTSESSPTARPIPIDDLYFTRSLAGASWSPDGKEILLHHRHLRPDESVEGERGRRMAACSSHSPTSGNSTAPGRLTASGSLSARRWRQ